MSEGQFPLWIDGLDMPVSLQPLCGDKLCIPCKARMKAKGSRFFRGYSDIEAKERLKAILERKLYQ
jgi:hypothetical protein